MFNCRSHYIIDKTGLLTIIKKRCLHGENNHISHSPNHHGSSSQSQIVVNATGLVERNTARTPTETQQYSTLQSTSSSPEVEAPQNPTSQIHANNGAETSITASEKTAVTETPLLVPHRFVGNLNPEATFLERVPASHQVTSQQSTRDDVGIWVNESDWDIMHLQKHMSDAATATRPPGSFKNNTSLLQESDQHVLIDLYFSRIHPIIPIVLVGAMCLVAAKDHQAEPYLRLQPDRGIIMKPRDFCKALHTSVRDALKNNLRCDRITLIRIHTLMSLHTEGPNGAEEASMYLAQAIHHSFTIGLHLGKSGGPTDNQSLMKLFWCIWSLDKLNAATNGRPVMIGDRDLGISTYVPEKPYDAAFGIWLKIAAMLNRVIDLYRPSTLPSVTGWEDDFPMFEEMVDEQNGWHLSTSLLGMC